MGKPICTSIAHWLSFMELLQVASLWGTVGPSPSPPLRDQWFQLADESFLLSKDMEKWHSWPGTALNTSSPIFLTISKLLHSMGAGESWALLGLCTQPLGCNGVHKAKISRATRQRKSRHNHQAPEWCHTWNQPEVFVQLLADDTKKTPQRKLQA